MRVAKNPCCSTCASRGSSSAPASKARSSCRWARLRRAYKKSTRRNRSWPSATTAGAACRSPCSWKRPAIRTFIISSGGWMPGPGWSIQPCRCISVGVLLLAVAAFPAVAEDLLQVYRDAQRYDAVYTGARYSLEAGRERIPQARALLLPSLSVTASGAAVRIEQESNNELLAPPFVRSPTTRAYTFSLSQPVYRPQNFAQYQQADWQVRQAEATYGQAAQDLALRVSQAYFDVQAAQDTLTLVGAQKAAISEQLAQAKRNFEVGTATITDTHEAQARYDLIIAQEIAAQNDLESKRRALETVGGKEYVQLKPLRPDVRLTQPNPPDMQSWVDLAEKQAYPVAVQQAATEIAALELKRNQNAHMPTADLVSTYGYTDQTSTITQSVGSQLTQATIGVQL